MMEVGWKGGGGAGGGKKNTKFERSRTIEQEHTHKKLTKKGGNYFDNRALKVH
jgi:hypothetical protein